MQWPPTVTNKEDINEMLARIFVRLNETVHAEFPINNRDLIFFLRTLQRVFFRD